MPSSLITGVTKEVLDSSIYRYIQEELGYMITSSHKMIRADKPNQWDHDYLGNEEPDSIIEVEQVVFPGHGSRSSTRSRDTVTISSSLLPFTSVDE